MKSSIYYFHIKTKILADFQICISVPLNVRSGEHIGLSPLSGNRVACEPSATSSHLLLHEHNNSSFNNFSILCRENNALKLSLRESILIKRNFPELNRNVGSIPLQLFNL